MITFSSAQTVLFFFANSSFCSFFESEDSPNFPASSTSFPFTHLTVIIQQETESLWYNGTFGCSRAASGLFQISFNFSCLFSAFSFKLAIISFNLLMEISYRLFNRLINSSCNGPPKPSPTFSIRFPN